VEYDIAFSQTQWTLVLASLVVAGFALVAGFVYTLTTQSELTARYRPSSVAGGALQLVAFFAYVVLTLAWIFGYKHVGNSYAPNTGFRFDNGFRYVDWAVTVPLLMMELTAVMKLTGPARQKLRSVIVPSTFLMVVTGFIGTDPASNHDRDHGTLLLWGGISTVFFVIAFAVLYPAIFSSMKQMPADARVSLRNAASLLIFTWGVYPIVYMFPVFFGTGSADAAVTRQLLFSVTDVVAKAGFGILIHKIAKQLSAADVNAGLDTHPEPIYISGEKVSEARPAVAVALLGSGTTEDSAQGSYPAGGRGAHGVGAVADTPR